MSDDRSRSRTIGERVARVMPACVTPRAYVRQLPTSPKTSTRDGWTGIDDASDKENADESAR